MVGEVGRCGQDGAVSDEKSELRADMRAVRRAIASDPEERARRSAAAWDNMLAVLAHRPLPGELDVMMFDSLPTEPDTTAWKHDASARGWRVYVPQVDGDALRVMPGDLDPSLLHVVIVPGLAFTVDGHRLGQGGGHYDRFLARLAPDCLTIGVCFHEQLVPALPTDQHDRQVDAVVTDAAAVP